MLQLYPVSILAVLLILQRVSTRFSITLRVSIALYGQSNCDHYLWRTKLYMTLKTFTTEQTKIRNA